MSEPTEPTPDPLEPDSSLPTEIRGIDPGELFARGMQSVKMSSAGAHGWTPPTPQEVSSLFPSYEILSMLGRGGMGAVYQARQIALDRFVAIKLLPLEVSVNRDFAERFRREARAMAKLNHPHIVTVHDFGQTSEGHLFFAMEFVEGANLSDIIHGPGLAPDQALSIAAQVCTALAYAHGKGVVHRDIKPANVMIDTESHVKVADFGLARLTDPTAETAGTTVTGTVMGTPDYMAPEQMKGMNVDHRADIYSLGVMLYEMLCRETPRGAFDLPSARTGCDPRLDAIVLKAMQQAPERRYQSTQEMKADVESARTPPVVPSVAPQTDAAREVAQPDLPAPPKLAAQRAIAQRATKKSKLPLAAGLALVAVAVIVAAILRARQPKPTAGPPPAPTFSTATKDAPFVNGLGMKFVPVPITGGPKGGQRVLFSVWETRVQDYEAYTKAKSSTAANPRFPQEPTHPVVNVSWHDARAFCAWLTEHERRTGHLGATESYRLPTDHEWSCAAGLGDREDPAKSPAEKHMKIPDEHPWGLAWPPPPGAGNFSGEEARGRVAWTGQRFIADYRDAFPYTAPVGSFAANPFGLHDLGGNVYEWCEDPYTPTSANRVLRGSAFDSSNWQSCFSSNRDGGRTPTTRGASLGFRVVLAPTVSVSSGGQSPAIAADKPLSSGDVLTFGGHRYQFVPGAKTWTSAKGVAGGPGGHLATITSKEEHEAVAGWLSHLLAEGDLATIGGEQRTISEAWRWTTGEAFTFLAWLPAEPNGPGGDGPDGRYPLGLSYLRKAGAVGWNDSSQHRTFRNVGFIVEWDSPAESITPAPAATPAAATKDAPFVNTLGMKFVPVPITGGPTGGQRVLFSVWETRVQDYAVFVDETKHTWRKPKFAKEPTHPATNIAWGAAVAFCEWLTARERQSGRIGSNEVYRLPSDWEWTNAMGIAGRENPALTARENSLTISSSSNGRHFPWGEAFPPPAGSGNFAGEESVGSEVNEGQQPIAGYRDPFPTTAPVGSFPANPFGLFDLAGNAAEMVQDWHQEEVNRRSARGGGFASSRQYLLASSRSWVISQIPEISHGFRVVLAPASAPPPAAK